MTTGRLTRQELGWLLAQEARGAAKILRQDVTLLSQPPPADPSIQPVVIPDVRVSTTLDALDDAIGLLSVLESGPSSKAPRRGRIDLAALLWEIAPTAQISIEPGAGTEVFGEESDLRRILHVLVQLSNSAAGQEAATSPVRIRREGDWIRIGVDLGPDVSASLDLERRWLSRMATQMGGHLDLEGGTIALLLPADASNDQSEVADLRKELEQAQQLGEAYARELAAAFAAGQPAAAPAEEIDRPEVAARRFEILLGLASAVHRVLSPVFRGLRDDAENMDGGPPSDALSTHVASGFDLVSELGRVASCPRTEAAESVDLARVVRDKTSEAEGRADRLGVSIAVDAPAEFLLNTRPKAFALLVRSLVDHAVEATPRGGTVAIVLTSDSNGPVIAVRDGGTVVPVSARADLLEHRVDPASLGRPPGLGLLVANTVAAHLGTPARIVDSADGGSVVEIRPRAL